MARGSGRRARIGGALAVVISCCAMTGCPPRGPASRGDATNATELTPLEARRAFEPLVAAHNARVALFESFVAPAAVVLRYPEFDRGVDREFDRGVDREVEQQLDASISLASGGRGALELKLLGKTWAWLGGDGSRSWVYMAAGEQPSQLHVYERLTDGTNTEAGALIGGAELTLLTPASLRLLLGLAPIAPEWSLVPIVPTDGTPIDGAPAARFEVRWNPTPVAIARMRLDSAGAPLSIVVTDLAGSEIVRALHAEPLRVRRENIAMGAWPAVARRISIRASRSRSSATILLDAEALARPMRAPKERFFDLAAMQLYLAPEEVIVHDPSSAVRPAPAAGASPRKVR